MRSANGLKKFKQETRYPHNRSEGTALRRTNGGTKVLIRERDGEFEDKSMHAVWGEPEDPR